MLEDRLGSIEENLRGLNLHMASIDKKLDSFGEAIHSLHYSLNGGCKSGGCGEEEPEKKKEVEA